MVSLILSLLKISGRPYWPLGITKGEHIEILRVTFLGGESHFNTRLTTRRKSFDDTRKGLNANDSTYNT